MNALEFYGPYYDQLTQVRKTLLSLIRRYPKKPFSDMKAILSCQSRIKSPESMTAKLRRKSLSPTPENAVTQTHDAIGVRIICAFVDDVYEVAKWLARQDVFETVEIRDYIAYPKPNGYRSYHMIVRMKGEGVDGLPAEIQLRTIAIDFWATLEHQMKYKRDVGGDEALIRAELKRCADEIASTDLSMLTIRDLIRSSGARKRS